MLAQPPARRTQITPPPGRRASSTVTSAPAASADRLPEEGAASWRSATLRTVRRRAPFLGSVVAGGGRAGLRERPGLRPGDTGADASRALAGLPARLRLRLRLFVSVDVLVLSRLGLVRLPLRPRLVDLWRDVPDLGSRSIHVLGSDCV